MKSLIDLLEVRKEDLPSIYCDMDQVLCAFMKAADSAVGGSFVQADKTDRWNKINQVKGFWENLEWMPGAKALYKKIMKYDAHILSAYSGRDPTSRTGKMKWLAKNTDFKRSKINIKQNKLTNLGNNTIYSSCNFNISRWRILWKKKIS